LEQTPGYQFQLQRGVETGAERGGGTRLGVSGASLKGAAEFVTGLADKNYQNQFANAQAAV
jgi:hypothetical protein